MVWPTNRTGVSRIRRMSSVRTSAVGGLSGIVAGGNIAGLGDAVGRRLVFGAVAEGTGWPWAAVVVGKVYTAVVPGVTFSIEAASRLDRNQR